MCSRRTVSIFGHLANFLFREVFYRNVKTTGNTCRSVSISLLLSLNKTLLCAWIYFANSCYLETVKRFLSPKSISLYIFVEFTFLFNLNNTLLQIVLKFVNVPMCKILTSVFSIVLILRFPECDVDQLRDGH